MINTDEINGKIKRVIFTEEEIRQKIAEAGE